MEIDPFGHQQVVILGSKARAVGDQSMGGDFVQVEQCRRQESVFGGSVEGAEHVVGFQTDQSARGGGTQLRHDGHQWSGANMTLDDLVILSVEASINRVGNPVAQPSAGMLQERTGKEFLPLRREGHLNWIVHTAADQRFDQRGVGMPPEDMGG